jgi:hypothetical protein
MEEDRATVGDDLGRNSSASAVAVTPCRQSGFPAERVAFADDRDFGAFLLADIDIRDSSRAARKRPTPIIVAGSRGLPCTIAPTRFRARSMKQS